jgi:hypothetical protein
MSSVVVLRYLASDSISKRNADVANSRGMALTTPREEAKFLATIIHHLESNLNLENEFHELEH